MSEEFSSADVAARQSIRLRLVEEILENPNAEMTALDMEYWDSVHDKLKYKLLHPPLRELSDEEVLKLWRNENGKIPTKRGELLTVHLMDILGFARAILAAARRQP